MRLREFIRFTNIFLRRFISSFICVGNRVNVCFRRLGFFSPLFIAKARQNYRPTRFTLKFFDKFSQQCARRFFVGVSLTLLTMYKHLKMIQSRIQGKKIDGNYNKTRSFEIFPEVKLRSNIPKVKFFACRLKNINNDLRNICKNADRNKRQLSSTI